MRVIVEGPDHKLPKILRLIRGFKTVTITDDVPAGMLDSAEVIKLKAAMEKLVDERVRVESELVALKTENERLKSQLKALTPPSDKTDKNVGARSKK